MLKLFPRSKEDENEKIGNFIRKLDAQYVKMALEVEKLKTLSKKIDEISTKLRKIERIVEESGVKPQNFTLSGRTKEAIKLILQKHGELTPLQLSKLINLSRTRCNEYLKQLELEGFLTSRTYCRKKYYSIRQ